MPTEHKGGLRIILREKVGSDAGPVHLCLLMNTLVYFAISEILRKRFPLGADDIKRNRVHNGELTVGVQLRLLQKCVNVFEPCIANQMAVGDSLAE